MLRERTDSFQNEGLRVLMVPLFFLRLTAGSKMLTFSSTRLLKRCTMDESMRLRHTSLRR